MLCSKCGNRNEWDLKFCNTCGTPVPLKDLHKLGKRNDPSGLYNFKNIAKFDASDPERETVSIYGFVLDAGFLYRLLSALLLLSFFLPFFRVSAPGFIRRAYTISGFHVTFGWEASDGSAMGYILFLVPVIIFALFQFKKEIHKHAAVLRDWFFAIALGLVILGLIALIASWASINTPLISLWPHIGFVFTLLLYAIAGAVSIGFVLARTKKGNKNGNRR